MVATTPKGVKKKNYRNKNTPLGVAHRLINSNTFEVLKKLYLYTLFTLLIGTHCMAQNIESVKNVKDIKNKKAFEWGGNVSIGGSYYNSNSKTKRMAPYNWYVAGSPFMKIYGINIPFSFTYSETGRSLTHPFHYQFTGASPYYKWATTHIGYRSMNFSQYTMSGVVFNGFGFEIKPKKFYLGAFYGVFNPANDIDSTDNNFGVILPSFKRIGYGLKIGYGKEKSYFNLSIFRGKDDPNSLKHLPNFQTIKPMDNVSFGPSFKVTILKRWYIESEAALSIITRNVLNDSLKETKDLQNIYKIIRVNTTTYGAFAGHVATGLNFNKWQIAFRVRQVSSDYQSLGINLLQDDIREYTANPTVSLFKSKVNLSGSYGFYSDNISQKRINTTKRKILNTNLNLSPVPKLNISLGYNNFGTTRTNGLVQMNDSITFSIINTAYTGNVSYNFGTAKKPFFVSLFGNYQLADDRNIFTQKYNNSKVLNGGLNSQYQFEKQKIQLSGGITFAKFEAGGQHFDTRSAQTSINKSFKDKKFKSGLSLTYSERFNEGLKQGNVMAANATFQTTIAKKHNIQSQIRLMRNTTGIVSNAAFNEQRASLQYGFSF